MGEKEDEKVTPCKSREYYTASGGPSYMLRMVRMRLAGLPGTLKKRLSEKGGGEKILNIEKEKKPVNRWV